MGGALASPADELADLPQTRNPRGRKRRAFDEADEDLPAPRARPAPPNPARGAPRGRPIAPPLPPASKQTQAGQASDLGDDLDLAVAVSPPRAKPQPRPLPDLEVDLPAPKGASLEPDDPDGLDFDIDLPAAAPSSDESIDLPAARSFARPNDELDLPGPVAPRSALEADAPNPFDDLDLPAAAVAVDLPQPKASVVEQAEEAFGDLDLPMPSRTGAAPVGGDDDFGSGGFGDLDLPMPNAAKARASDPFGEVDLPTPRSELGPASGDFALDLGDIGGIDLPVPRDATDLPAAMHSVDLPAPMDGGIDLPVPIGEEDLPVPMQGDGLGFDDLALPEPRDLGADPAFSQTMGAEPLSHGTRAGAGGVGYGELDLGEAAVDDMEFADIPQTEGGAGGLLDDSLPPPRVAVEKKRDRAQTEPKKTSKAVWIAVAVLALIVGAGGALHFTPYGAFGMYFFDRFLPGSGDPAQVRAAITSAEEVANSDRWQDVRQALVTLGNARHGAGLNRELLARSLVHEGIYQVRFGDDPRSPSRASAIRTRLSERGAEGPELALAHAADSLVQGSAGAARGFLAQARAHAPNDPYVDLVAGEIALIENDLEAAVALFTAAADGGAGARGLWGVVRARLLGDNDEEIDTALETVLAASPTHGQALVTVAERSMAAGENEEAIAIAERIVGISEEGGPAVGTAEPAARARAWSMIGRAREARGRTTLALEAFDAALAADDSHVPALLGAGRVLLEDRPADALVRFESVMQVDGAAETQTASGRTALQEAQLGAGRASLELEQIQDAHALLSALAAQLDADADVLLWAGKVEEALEPPNDDAAEQLYRDAILADPVQFGAYLALAELFLRTERDVEAGAVLEQAAERVPESGNMRSQLGAFELRRGQLPRAIQELTRALELDDSNTRALFSLGVAYRRSNRLAESSRTFDRLAEVDPGHPGLALERGLLFEARGDSERAVAQYRAALEDQPDDMDLLLRLGAAQVSAGQIDEAEETLERVRQARPGSAEAHHFVGRIAFARGLYADALIQFRQALQLDATRGEYYLWAGWAALESGHLGEALLAENQAIERDPTLGDAYWLRGRIKLRQGLPDSALEDLTTARRLSPGRVDVLADLGDVYDQLRRVPEAIASYEQAVAQVDDNGGWWYTLGRFRLDRGDRAQAGEALTRATLLGEAMAPRPVWLADAHRLQGDTLRFANRTDEAIPHYQRYLELAAPNAIDRDDVRRLLDRLGASPNR